MKRRILYLTLFLIFNFLRVSAQEVPDDHIFKTASSFLRGFLSDMTHKPLAVKHISLENNDLLCVVDLSPEGWLLMSRDYSSLPVLAFSLTGDFIMPGTDLNDNRYVMLAGYARQLNDSVGLKSSFTDPHWSSSYNYAGESLTKGTKATVSPLIKVNWNQGTGWNRFCPVDTEGPGGHVYAGCVAVSMAQAMSVYGVPAKGKGSNNYVLPVYGSIYVDFSTAEYNWAAMGASVADDNNAKLIYHCAVASTMDFGPDGSGTRTTASASGALKEYYYYSERIAWTKRPLDTEQWKTLLDKNLLAGRPIIYSGLPESGSTGHAFDIDGVFQSNYYHVNWGWSGVDNGYFIIDNLKPGGSDFTREQAAIFNIQPYYYPTGMMLSDTLVFLSQPKGVGVGKFTVIDEAVDNSYTVNLECDSAFIAGVWVKDYYLDGDSLRTNRTFIRGDGPVDTVTFVIRDTHNNLVKTNNLLLLTASLSASDPLAEEAIELYPVPAGDQVFLTVPHDTYRLTITTLDGNVVYMLEPSDTRINIPVGHFPAGYYTVNVFMKNGRHFSKPFVKK